MFEKELINVRFFKKLTLFDIVLFFAFIASIFSCYILDKQQLIYVVPLSILLVIIKYISITKKNANPLYISGLLALIISNCFAFYGFMEYFIWVTLFNSIYLVCCSLLLKPYLFKSRLKSLISLSVLLAFLLVAYVIFIIVEVLISHIPNYLLYFAFINAMCFIIYSILFALIYINDHYKNGSILLGSGLFSIVQTTLTPINEFLYYNDTFTASIIFSQFLSVILLLVFITKTKAEDAAKISNKYF